MTRHAVARQRAGSGPREVVLEMRFMQALETGGCNTPTNRARAYIGMILLLFLEIHAG